MAVNELQPDLGDSLAALVFFSDATSPLHRRRRGQVEVRSGPIFAVTSPASCAKGRAMARSSTARKAAADTQAPPRPRQRREEKRKPDPEWWRTAARRSVNQKLCP